MAVPATDHFQRNPMATCAYLAAGSKEVVLTRKAGEAVLRGSHPYAPGVLAASAGLTPGDLVAVSLMVERPGALCHHLDVISMLHACSSS